LNITAILSGGKGERFGSTLPKQYHNLAGEEVIAYPINAAKSSENGGKIVVAAAPEYADDIRERYNVDVTASGETHNQTVKHILDNVRENYPDCEKIVFLDSVRPLVTAEIVDTFFALLDDFDGVITAGHITDSLGYADRMFTDRADYYLIQKPEGFRFDPLYNCFDAKSPCTAIVQQLPAGTKIKKYFEFRKNLKITYPEDLEYAEFVLKNVRR
jgi:2-C-methyl-D-erythritol 4-phosphate cytidylyltransferase